MTDRAALLRVENLSVAYQGHGAGTLAVNQVSFSLSEGEILAIIGESGAGKSAIAQAIPGLLPANAKVSGQIVFEDQPLLELAPAQLAAVRGRDIAMIFQDPSSSLDPVFSVGKQLDESIALSDPTLDARQRRNRALELLSQVGIPQAGQRLKSYPHQFSGGQMQRIMIAMALAGRPKILIADEPTTALDVTTQQEILDLLFTLNRQFNMAVLLITHDMGVVADIAQRVIVMRQGKVVEQRAVGPLFTHPEHDYTRQLLAAMPAPANHQSIAAGDGRENFTERLRVQNLRVNYAGSLGRSYRAIDDVSFSIGRGEFVGLLGESGSGKSTIGRAVLGIVRPESGIISLSGQSVYPLDKKARQKIQSSIGAIFQNPSSSLNPRMTIGQSIAEPLVTHSDMTRDAVSRRVSSLIDLVGLPAAWHGRYPYELSGGQCQRIAIARAIALSPELLIADEPTSALDVSIQQNILTLLRDLQQEYRFACLFISHDLAVVRSLCHTALVLKNGRIVESGQVSTLFQHPESQYTRTLIDSIPLPNPQYQQDKRRARFPGLFKYHTAN